MTNATSVSSTNSWSKYPHLQHRNHSPTMTKPTLVIIPGLWESPTAFYKVVNILTSHHKYPTEVIPPPNTGTNAPEAKTFSSDVSFIRVNGRGTRPERHRNGLHHALRRRIHRSTSHQKTLASHRESCVEEPLFRTTVTNPHLQVQPSYQNQQPTKNQNDRT